MLLMHFIDLLLMLRAMGTEVRLREAGRGRVTSQWAAGPGAEFGHRGGSADPRQARTSGQPVQLLMCHNLQQVPCPGGISTASVTISMLT